MISILLWLLKVTALDAGVDKEVCPLNLAPTASTTVAMAIGDALAVVWMEKELYQKDFAINHPRANLVEN